jgi:hypothetical protein
MIKSTKEQFKRTFNLVMIWILIGVAFGFLYHFLPGELINTRTGEPIHNLLDAIYFSFVTILTTGYGDITANGFIRVLTAVEGLLGWILFGIIVYRVVSVKEDLILKEIHNLSNDQYLSRIRNFLFISNTNLTRFIKEIHSKKRPKDSAIYELSVISTTLRSNIEDATRFLAMNKGSVSMELEKEEILLLVNAVNLCIANFITSILILPKHEKDQILADNIIKIIESAKNIYNTCSSDIKDKKIDDLKALYTKLEEMEK